MKLLAETIGVDKILFGSDWPHGEGLADPMTFTADIPQFPEFSDEDTRKVMRDNALDLLGVNVRRDRHVAPWASGPSAMSSTPSPTSFRDRTMTVCGDRRTTYGEMAERTRRLANFLADKGFGAHRERDGLDNWECGQDRVALIMYNDRYPEMVVGCLKARTVPVNVNHHYTPREVADLLDYVKPRAVIYHRALGAKFADVLRRTGRRPADLGRRRQRRPGPRRGRSTWTTLWRKVIRNAGSRRRRTTSSCTARAARPAAEGRAVAAERHLRVVDGGRRPRVRRPRSTTRCAATRARRGSRCRR